MKIIEEFKAFAMKGNVVDMAIGIIIGAAFGGVVTSLVTDVLTPPIGALIGGIDFSAFAIKLSNPLNGSNPVEILYGKFLNAVFNFFIAALAVFILVKAMNRLKKKVETAPDTVQMPSEEVVLLTQIRDLLSKK
ncbi:MAG: large conductance mechanosensitive channel [Ignavibacteria bacterium]|nr:MAG: large conductance mechanosensitive channel [Ignavibacteria bacterium]KAF0161603.1 MAG: large conductance mechanosensitive channel [Ignavibacteria bacterium]